MNTGPWILDLFPEAPAPAPVPVERKRRRTLAVPPRVAAPLVAAAEPAALATPALGDPEALALALDSHPDYRVLRRLQPRLEWPVATHPDITRVVVLDTETTGLDQSRERIIELALVCVDVDNRSGLPVGSVQVYDGLEDPGKPIPREVVALTGIHDADVRGQTLDEARIDALLQGAVLVIAHNAGFDRPFAERRIARFASLPWACSFADLDWKAQGRSSAKLESLALACGWFYDAHRAEMDCHALLAVLTAPLPIGEGTGLLQLMRCAAQPSFSLQASQAPFEEKDRLKARGYRWNAEQRVWQTRLRDSAALQEECLWLKENVYGGRAATVQIEAVDALTKYSPRPGQVHQRVL